MHFHSAIPNQISILPPNKLLFKLAPYLLHATATAYTPPQIQPCIYTTLHAFKSTNTHQCVYRCFVSWSGAPNFQSAEGAVHWSGAPNFQSTPRGPPENLERGAPKARRARDFQGGLWGYFEQFGAQPSSRRGSAKIKKNMFLSHP